MTQSEADQCVRELFLSWYPTAVRVAFRLCGSIESAEDVVQDAFRQLFLALRNGGEVKNPKAWTYCVIRREIIHRHRASLRRPESLEPSSLMDLRPGIEPLPDAVIADDELTCLLSRLTAREQEALLLRMQGLRYREIASSLHISLNSVKTLLARGLRKLQASTVETAQAAAPSGRLQKLKRYVVKTLY